MQKAFVLIGTPEKMSQEDFRTQYLQDHANSLLSNDSIGSYVANVIEEPSIELQQAGWGWGEKDDSGIRAIDEIWIKEGSALDFYENDARVIGAYNVDEVVLRSCLTHYPLKEKTPWIKRMGLLKCLEGQRQEDFFAYWEKIHGPLALRVHIGAGVYRQHHFTEVLKAAPTAWNGSMSLNYWNIDAFQYGHFSQPDSVEIIKADGAHFMNIFLALLASEYVMRH